MRGLPPRYDAGCLAEIGVGVEEHIGELFDDIRFAHADGLKDGDDVGEVKGELVALQDVVA